MAKAKKTRRKPERLDRQEIDRVSGEVARFLIIWGYPHAWRLPLDHARSPLRLQRHIQASNQLTASGVSPIEFFEDYLIQIRRAQQRIGKQPKSAAKSASVSLDPVRRLLVSDSLRPKGKWKPAVAAQDQATRMLIWLRFSVACRFAAGLAGFGLNSPRKTQSEILRWLLIDCWPEYGVAALKATLHDLEVIARHGDSPK